MITKDYLEKHLKRSGNVTVYSEDSIALHITKTPCIRCNGVQMADFEVDCSDLAEYCNHMGLTMKPSKHN